MAPAYSAEADMVDAVTVEKSNGVISLSSSLPSHLQAKDSQQSSRATSILAQDTRKMNLGDAPNSEDSDDELAGGHSDSATEHRSLAALPTGLCYDSRMRWHTELDPTPESDDFHPEDPRRIYHIYKAICEAGLYADKKLTPIGRLVQRPLERIISRYATKDEVCLVHTTDHFNFIKSTATFDDEQLISLGKSFDSIYFSTNTYICSLLSTGSAVETVMAVAEGRMKNAMAVIRPPGHHAECDRSMGFCHFDNVSVAAKVAQQKHPDVRKILILDWDVHHGNGIQQAFESDPNVLYISIHVHQNGNFYPSGNYGDHLHCGVGAGVGKNINIPWSTKGMGNADYLFAFQHIVMPVAYDFAPDLVLIAAGFDAAEGDQLGGCFVTPDCYAHMTYMLMSLADGKLVACLEGGYNLQSISNSALGVTKTLMGYAPPKISPTAATLKGIATVREVIQQQSKYWTCLMPREPSTSMDQLSDPERIHDVLRSYQAKILYERHKMIPLQIFRAELSRSFENQVLATTTYTGEQPLLLIFHDPPEVFSTPNAMTGKLDLHRAFLADGLKRYISWAIENGFSVIDVNVPQFLTGVSNPEGDEEQELLKITQQTEKLATYLWENYVEPNDARQVFMLGVGAAHTRAVVHLLNTRTWETFTQLESGGIVGFLGEDDSLISVQEHFMTDLGRWYFNSSMVFVDSKHPVWHPDRQRRPGKRFGRVIKGDANGTALMLERFFENVTTFLASKKMTGAEDSDVDMR